jgi:hypothetical protein
METYQGAFDTRDCDLNLNFLIKLLLLRAGSSELFEV